MYMNVSEGRYPRSQKMESDPKDLELQAFVSHEMWVLGTEFDSSERTECTFNHRAISPALFWL